MVFDKVKEIIIDQLGLDPDTKVAMETSLINDLEADSLDAVEVIMAIEDEFDVEIPDEDAEDFKNIGDIVKYVEEKK
ncbi:acyl carrier protein [Wukongibacter baidiensis]|uniref:acyl carrier protein n=1 Tax=Wukongibacter baidiensis TaxID=1723361 RepID=UPI003D7FA406